MKRTLVIVGMALCVTASAETLFYCSTSKNKHVFVEQKGAVVRYSYGKDLEKPEILLQKNINEVSFAHEAYSGGGASVITIYNGSYSYEMRSGIRKVCFNAQCKKWHEDFGELTVMKGNTVLAEIVCNPESIKYHDPIR